MWKFYSQVSQTKLPVCDSSRNNDIKLTSISSWVCLSILKMSVATYSSDSSLPSSIVGGSVGLTAGRDEELAVATSAVMDAVLGCSIGGLLAGGGSRKDLKKI